MWVKKCHKQPMTGNGKNTTYKNGDDWGMVKMALLYPHYYIFRQMGAKISRSRSQQPLALGTGESSSSSNCHNNNFIQDGAPKIAFSWFISGLTMVYGRYNYS